MRGRDRFYGGMIRNTLHACFKLSMRTVSNHNILENDSVNTVTNREHALICSCILTILYHMKLASTLQWLMYDYD